MRNGQSDLTYKPLVFDNTVTITSALWYYFVHANDTLSRLQYLERYYNGALAYC